VTATRPGVCERTSVTATRPGVCERTSVTATRPGVCERTSVTAARGVTKKIPVIDRFVRKLSGTCHMYIRGSAQRRSHHSGASSRR